MHPNAFLRTFWQGDIRPEIFVAMSFAPEYEDRFKHVIEPAIQATIYQGRQLRANRVDLSKSGDSILTDIVDGIAHSEMVLADVSTVGNDSKTGKRYRNGNVMYEVGIALACRHSSDVLLIRDDQDTFLFDVSTIPHKRLDFTNHRAAQETLAEELVSRLRERTLLDDARVARAIAGLTAQERTTLKAFSNQTLDSTFYANEKHLGTMFAFPRLLDKQLITTVGVTSKGHALFRWTRLGYEISQKIDSLIPVVPINGPPEGSNPPAP